MMSFSPKLLALLPWLLVIIATNYIVDPGNLFHHGFEAAAAESILAGKSIDSANVDYRLFQKCIIEKLGVPRDVIVLGSSRGLQVRSTQFGGLSFFNHSVPGARLEDLLAIYQHYVERNLTPRWIIFALDPIMFSKNVRPVLMSLTAEYRAMCRALGVRPRANATPSWSGRYVELAMPHYLRASLQRLIANSGRSRRNPAAVRPTVDAEDDRLMVRPDGSGRYPVNVLTQRKSVVRRMVRRDTQMLLSVSAFGEVDREVQREFEAFLGFLRRQQIGVVLVLPPVHPLLIEKVRSAPFGATITAVERYLDSVARQNNLQILGSFDAARAGCDEGDFFDGVHAKESCLDHIIAPWASSLQVKEDTESSASVAFSQR